MSLGQRHRHINVVDSFSFAGLKDGHYETGVNSVDDHIGVGQSDQRRKILNTGSIDRCSCKTVIAEAIYGCFGSCQIAIGHHHLCNKCAT